MRALLATLFSVGAIGINLALTVYLMDVVKIVSAVQAAWGRPEGAAESIPWLPLFVIIPAAAIGGALFAAERYFRLAEREGVKGLVRFALRMGSVQAAAWWAGRALLVLVRPVQRTPAEFAALILLGMLAAILWVFPGTLWGKRLLAVGNRKGPNTTRRFT